MVYAATHQVFEGRDAALPLAEGTPASWRAYADAAIRFQTDDRGAKRFAVGARNTFSPAGRFIHIRNQAKTRSQVDSNCPWHMPSLRILNFPRLPLRAFHASANTNSNADTLAGERECRLAVFLRIVEELA